MKIANHAGRAMLLATPDEGVDIAATSEGRFGPSMDAVLAEWEDFAAWARDADLAAAERTPVDRARLESPSPSPRQVIAVGLNYREHAHESGFEVPHELPPTFTKFVSSIAGTQTVVELPPGGNTDWEVELVVVVGRGGRGITADRAWSHVAGVAVGQDLSERVSQLSGPAPQFSLGKSFAGFAPIGPWLVTPDELPDPDDLELGAAIDGRIVQEGRTRDLIFPVPELIARISRTLELYPGDVIFTGTPAGVGLGRTPPRFLQPGERLESWIVGVGRIEQQFVASTGAADGGIR